MSKSFVLRKYEMPTYGLKKIDDLLMGSLKNKLSLFSVASNRIVILMG